jgi:hypothetical protein
MPRSAARVGSAQRQTAVTMSATALLMVECNFAMAILRRSDSENVYPQPSTKSAILNVELRPDDDLESEEKLRAADNLASIGPTYENTV